MSNYHIFITLVIKEWPKYVFLKLRFHKLYTLSIKWVQTNFIKINKFNYKIVYLWINNYNSLSFHRSQYNRFAFSIFQVQDVSVTLRWSFSLYSWLFYPSEQRSQPLQRTTVDPIEASVWKPDSDRSPCTRKISR